MGNLRFRLSNIMPNAWFYKLKYMSAGSGAGTRTTSHKRRNTNKFPRNSPPSPPPSSTPSKPNQPHHHNQYSYSRKSYYFTRDLHPPTPRKSSKLRAAKRRPPSDAARPPSPELVSSVSGGCSCRANWTKSDSPAVVVVAGDHSVSLSGSDSDSFPPELRSDCSLTTESFDKMVSWSSNSCGCPLELADSGSNDIIIDIDKRSLADPVRPALDSLPDRDLPRILTKPSSFDDRIEETKQEAARKQSRSSSPAKKVHDSKTRALSSLSSVKVGREENLTARQQGRKSNSANSPGIKLRVNSPRIGYRRSVHGQGRKSVTSSSTTTTTTTRSSSSSFSSSCSGASASKKSLSGCLAVVKSSFDPQTDFRESMVEMIVENNLSGSKDLEDLLVCYLSLNSDEYHGVIIKVFKQIWIDYITNSRSK